MTKPGDADESGADDVTPAAATPAEPTAATAHPNPFAAPVRAPRERWVNPAKRRSAALLAAVAAVVLLAVGILVGLAVGGGHDHRRDAGPRCVSGNGGLRYEDYLPAQRAGGCGERATGGWTFYRPGGAHRRGNDQNLPGRPGPSSFSSSASSPASSPASSLPSSSHS